MARGAHRRPPASADVKRVTTDGASLQPRAAAGAGARWTEPERVAALRAYGLADAPLDPALQRLVELAARLCGAATAQVNILDASRQWVAATSREQRRVVPRPFALCDLAVRTRSFVATADASTDERFATNPHVTGDLASVRSYAAAPLVDADGHVLGTLCLVDGKPGRFTSDQHDVLPALAQQVVSLLERHRDRGAERGRRRTSALLEAAFHGSPIGMALRELRTDQPAGFIRVNPALCGILGRSEQELLALGPVEVTHPDDRAAAERELTRLATGEVDRYVLDSRFVLPDGASVWCRVSGSVVVDDGHGVPLYAVTQIQDITAERAARRALAERAAALDAAYDPILCRTFDGAITYWNAAAAATYGISAEQAIGRRAHELLRTTLPDPIEQIHEQLLATGSWQGELTQEDARGNALIVSGRWSLQRDVDGEVVGVIESNVDLTEQREAEMVLLASRQRERALAEAERANAAKSDFLSRMSHELRTPLNAILGFAQLLEMDLTNDEQRDSLERIMTAGRHLLALINEVLDITRVENGGRSLEFSAIDVRDLVTSTVPLIAPLASARDVTVHVAGSAPAHVLADRQRLVQVLLNLLGNAVKYNRVGGSITVDWTVDATHVAIAIIDTGNGLTPEDCARLFTPFERLGAANDGSVEGTGLGLVLSRRLVQTMGGTLDVTSRPGIGSTFTAALPLLPIQLGSPAPTSTASRS
jgi:PAS domain S-box-containing protein